MLIGAHVSPAGGPGEGRRARRRARLRRDPDLQPEPAAVEAAATTPTRRSRRSARRCEPRDVDALLIHAVYLLNCASEDPEIREKSLRVADRLAARRRGARRARGRAARRLGAQGRRRRSTAIERAGEVIAEALAESEGCPLHLENTAGAGGTLGRSFDELARPARGRRRRRAARRLPGLLPPARLGLRRPHRGRRSPACSTSSTRSSASTASARCTSTTRRRRWAPTATATRALGEGELGREGCAVFLSEPRFEGLPCVLEGPGSTARASSRDGHRGSRARACASEGAGRARTG